MSLVKVVAFCELATDSSVKFLNEFPDISTNTPAEAVEDMVRQHCADDWGVAPDQIRILEIGIGEAVIEHPPFNS